MYGECLGGQTLLVYSLIEALFILMILAFEWLHDDIYDCLSENPPSLHLPVFQEIPF